MTAFRRLRATQINLQAPLTFHSQGDSAGGASAEGTDSPRYPDNDDLGTFVSLGETCDSIVARLVTGRDRDAQDAVERRADRSQSPRPTREASKAGAVHGFNSPNRYRGGKA